MLTDHHGEHPSSGATLFRGGHLSAFGNPFKKKKCHVLLPYTLPSLVPPYHVMYFFAHPIRHTNSFRLSSPCTRRVQKELNLSFFLRKPSFSVKACVNFFLPAGSVSHWQFIQASAHTASAHPIPASCKMTEHERRHPISHQILPKAWRHKG